MEKIVLLIEGESAEMRELFGLLHKLGKRPIWQDLHNILRDPWAIEKNHQPSMAIIAEGLREPAIELAVRMVYPKIREWIEWDGTHPPAKVMAFGLV